MIKFFCRQKNKFDVIFEAQDGKSKDVSQNIDGQFQTHDVVVKKFLKGQKQPRLKYLKIFKFLFFTFFYLLVFIITISAMIGYSLWQQVKVMKVKAEQLQFQGGQIYQAFKEQNLDLTISNLAKLKDAVLDLEKDYQKFSKVGNLFFLKNYYADGQKFFNASQYGLKATEQALQTLLPYADVLGFKGEGTFQGGSAEERLKIIIETLDKISPVLDGILADLNLANDEISDINVSKYPEKIKNFELKNKLIKVQQLSKMIIDVFVEYRPVIEQLPNIAGGKGTRKKYLILFQNDNELRPTGGFLTAYSIVFIENGKVYPEKSDDIYELDKKFIKKVAIPEILGKYLKSEKYFNLRDMNVSPDFKLSMDTFYQNYKTVKGEPQDIDGIIAVDTEFLTSLLTTLGPVELEGYGKFSSEIDSKCNCPQVVYALSEIITKPTPYIREDRKGILGPLMSAILKKAYSAPKELFPQLFGAFRQSVEGRHVQFYFFDEPAQLAVEKIKAAGRMLPLENSDFMAIVDANLAGAKSNLFVTYQVNQLITKTDEGWQKNVEITYRNNHQASNCNLEAGQLCLNSTLNDWFRLYVPSGSKLKEAIGFKDELAVYQENGFEVFDGVFSLEPNAQAKVKLIYTIPYNQNKYQGYFWKQGGVTDIKQIIDINGVSQELEMKKDLIVKE